VTYMVNGPAASLSGLTGHLHGDATFGEPAWNGHGRASSNIAVNPFRRKVESDKVRTKRSPVLSRKTKG
jgi:hypothetical protein